MAWANKVYTKGIGLYWHYNTGGVEYLLGFNAFSKFGSCTRLPVRNKLTGRLGVLVGELEDMMDDVLNSCIMFWELWGEVYMTLNDSIDEWDLPFVIDNAPIPFYEFAKIAYADHRKYGYIVRHYGNVERQLLAESCANRNMDYLIQLHQEECGCRFLPKRYRWNAKTMGIV